MKPFWKWLAKKPAVTTSFYVYNFSAVPYGQAQLQGLHWMVEGWDAAKSSHLRMIDAGVVSESSGEDEEADEEDEGGEDLLPIHKKWIGLTKDQQVHHVLVSHGAKWR